MHQKDTLSPDPAARAIDERDNHEAMARKYKAERDALLKSLKELLPYATIAIKEVQNKMVGNLYPHILQSKLDWAQEAIDNIK